MDPALSRFQITTPIRSFPGQKRQLGFRLRASESRPLLLRNEPRCERSYQRDTELHTFRPLPAGADSRGMSHAARPPRLLSMYWSPTHDLLVLLLLLLLLLPCPLNTRRSFTMSRRPTSPSVCPWAQGRKVGTPWTRRSASLFGWGPAPAPALQRMSGLELETYRSCPRCGWRWPYDRWCWSLPESFEFGEALRLRRVVTFCSAGCPDKLWCPTVSVIRGHLSETRCPPRLIIASTWSMDRSREDVLALRQRDRLEVLIRSSGDDELFFERLAQLRLTRASSLLGVEDGVVLVSASLALRRPVGRSQLACWVARLCCRDLAAAFSIYVWRQQASCGLPLLGPCEGCGQPTAGFCSVCGRPHCTACKGAFGPCCSGCRE